MEPLTNAMASGRTKTPSTSYPAENERMSTKKGEESSSNIQVSGDDLLVVPGGVLQSARHGLNVKMAHPGSTVSHRRFFFSTVC